MRARADRLRPPAPQGRGERAGGFTIVELIVALAIMLAVLGVVFTLMHPARGAFHVQLEASDVHQRLRVAADTIARDLRLAGAGPAVGTARGPLARALAPVMPHRIGGRGGETGTFHPDVLSVLYIPHTAAQGTIRLPDGVDELATTATALSIEPRPSCSPDAPLCGFTAGMRAIVFDRRGAWDLVTITGLMGDVLQIAYEGTLSAAYEAGVSIAEVSSRTYYLLSDPGAGTYQLRRYDGFESDLPLVDEVVGLRFEYFGDPEPPARLPGTLLSDPGPWTTYGPRPPEIDEDDPGDAWGPGENCVFEVAAGAHVPRLATFGAGQLIALDPGTLIDGPWCPDAVAPHRFDADLLRVRRVRVTLRVQAAPAALRGPPGELFTHGGTASNPRRSVPDMEISFDVALRNRP